MARDVTAGTIGHSCQRSGGRRVSERDNSTVAVGSGTNVGATMVFGGGAIGIVGLGVTNGRGVTVSVLASSLPAGAAHPARKTRARRKEQALLLISMGFR